MHMKFSAMTLHTLREAPNDAEAISHQLLVRAGYIRRLASGVYSYLPLGNRVLRNVSEIIRQAFDAQGAQEMLLPALHPLDIWEQTGRSLTMDDVLMRIHSKSGEFVLGPTHEEAMIATISPDLGSYRDLPAITYQIQTKFRDEPRARFGLMRTREFIMADAYSFDVDQDAMKLSYKKLYDAYFSAFERMAIPFTPVEADSGAIGGDVNHEFMSPSPIGEDHFAQCAECGYAANIEAAKRGAPADAPRSGTDAMAVHFTPGAPGVSDAIAGLRKEGVELDESGMLKCIATRAIDGTFVLLLVPGDREARLSGGLSLLDDESLRTSGIFIKGYIGPMGMSEKGVRVIADLSVVEGSSWATGANLDEHHVVNAVVGRDFHVDAYDSLVVVRDGDPCPRCGGTMSLVRAVEIGHTFQLGRTYSSKIPDARFAASDGTSSEYYMGCYGIGVTRLLAVLVEQFHDERGITWPLSVAPFQLGIYPIGYAKDEQVRRISEQCYERARLAGIDVLLDDRGASPGVMLSDADLIGLPYHLVIGSKGLAEGTVELRNRRTGDTTRYSVDNLDEVVAWVVAERRRADRTGD
ncbi:MAG: proline--tRNA ligase [Acidimicrobiales bacterium]